ncbi:MAG: MFS transporter [Gammaproteobacteria bacterium]|jgi:GPH family glycoside/pentoside/hexuronide:cation symporter|nr:MFS transporter [Gammaproteobacteria bacterium]MBT5052503.1 MFS transporter [Gammaproteobacteria bacterium]
MTPITRSTAWIYGSVSLPLAIISYPLAVWIPRLYSTEIGIDLGLIGLVIFFAAIFDAISDPAMGFMSDRFQTRWGRRKPWIVIGVPIYAVAVWMLLNPDQGSTVLYLALFFILLRLATTILGLPYAAWGMELSAEYHTRTMIQSAREKYVLAGLIVASAIVLISEEVFDNRSASFVLSNFSWVIVTLLPLTAILVILKVPEVAVPKAPSVSIVASLRQMTRNKLFFRLLMIELLIAGGENFRNTLSLFFVQDYVGADRVGRLYVLYFGVGLLAIPVWDWIARRFGKHQSLATAMVLVSIIAIACFMLDYGQVTEFYVLFALKGFCFGAFAYLPRAMLADVVDFDTVRSGTARPASYFAILGFMTKCAASFGGLSLPILGLVGYSVARNVTNGPTELMWLGILYAIVPTLMFVVAFYLCVTWPLNAKLHQRLERLVARKQARYAKD